MLLLLLLLDMSNEMCSVPRFEIPYDSFNRSRGLEPDPVSNDLSNDSAQKAPKRQIGVSKWTTDGIDEEKQRVQVEAPRNEVLRRLRHHCNSAKGNGHPERTNVA